jgi:hypothetical protein
MMPIAATQAPATAPAIGPRRRVRSSTPPQTRSAGAGGQVEGEGGGDSRSGGDRRGGGGRDAEAGERGEAEERDGEAGGARPERNRAGERVSCHGERAADGEGGIGGTNGGERLPGEQHGGGGDEQALGRVGERVEEARVERAEIAEGGVGRGGGG